MAEPEVNRGSELRGLEGLAESDIAGLRFDISESPEYAPQFAIATAGEAKRLLADGQIELAAEKIKTARRVTDYVWQRTEDRNRVFPQIHFTEGATEHGILGIAIDPDRQYSTSGQLLYTLKKVPSSVGIQAPIDSLHFQNDSNINLEHILANIPINGKSYLWKVFIIGPNLYDLLLTVEDGIARANEADAGLLSTLDKELVALASSRVMYWQTNAPPSIEPRSFEGIGRTYVNNLAEVLRGFSEHTDIAFAPEEIRDFRDAVSAFDWRFIRQENTKRNLAATYRNMILETGKLRADYPDILSSYFSANGGGRRKLKRDILAQDLFHVDTPVKYSHALEDFWDMELDLKGIRSQTKSIPRRYDKPVKFATDQYGQMGVAFTPKEIQLIGAYRSFRKAYLVLTRHMQRDHQDLQKDRIGQDEYERRNSVNRSFIGILLRKGYDKLAELQGHVSADAHSKVSSALHRLSGFKEIRYLPIVD